MKSLLLSLTFLSGCSLSPREPALPIMRSELLAVHNYSLCKEAVSKMQVYLRSEGFNLMVSHGGAAPRSLTCLSMPTLLPFVSLVPILGAAQGTGAFAFLTGSDNFDSKTVLHETLHLFGATHRAHGVMFPGAPFLHLATGADAATLKQIRGTEKF